MNTKEEVEKKENPLNETNLTDLPISQEQANSTKGGDGFHGEIHIESFSFGVSQGSSR